MDLRYLGSGWLRGRGRCRFQVGQFYNKHMININLQTEPYLTLIFTFVITIDFVHVVQVRHIHATHSAHTYKKNKHTLRQFLHLVP